jgi:hypothetical protein
LCICSGRLDVDELLAVMDTTAGVDDESVDGDRRFMRDVHFRMPPRSDPSGEADVPLLRRGSGQQPGMMTVQTHSIDTAVCN